MKRIIAVCGPTAVGKTKYSIEVARALGGEIVSADSMQLYKYMDIGSAKPTAEERALAVHHLVDEIDPRDGFSVAEYQEKAKAAINDIFKRGLTPVIAGGTGLYISSLIYDMNFAGAPADPEYRKELENIAALQGNEALHKMLSELDPSAAERIHPNNLKKMIRAIEVARNGEHIPEFSQSFKPTADYDYLLIGLERDREELYSRIDLRVDMLIQAGLTDEIKQLMAMGLTASDISMKGIGYKELIDCFNGAYDLEEAIRLIKRNTRHYAKRQMTWLRRYKEMHWVNLSSFGDNEDAALEAVLNICKEN